MNTSNHNQFTVVRIQRANDNELYLAVRFIFGAIPNWLDRQATSFEKNQKFTPAQRNAFLKVAIAEGYKYISLDLSNRVTFEGMHDLMPFDQAHPMRHMPDLKTQALSDKFLAALGLEPVSASKRNRCCIQLDIGHAAAQFKARLLKAGWTISGADAMGGGEVSTVFANSALPSAVISIDTVKGHPYLNKAYLIQG